MILEKIKQSQPVIYQMLKNEISNDKIAHAFLISGNDLLLKKELAIFLAQSIVEGNKDFACEECSICNRIKQNNYLDYIYIDGTKEPIKKEKIEAIQVQFSKQAVEKANKKVYVINGIENATIAGLNSLLKFLEEPNGETTHAILITNNINKLLPTIISRCQRIELKPSRYSSLYSEYKKIQDNNIKAHYLAQVLKYYDPEVLNDKEFDIAFEYLLEFKHYFKIDIDYFLYLVEANIFTITDKKDQITIIKYLLNMIYIYCKDLILNTRIDNDSYNKDDYVIPKDVIEKIMYHILESLSNVNITYDHKLVIEGLFYRIKGELNEQL